MKSVQDRFLNELRKSKVPCTIIIVNGYQLKNAIVQEFDNFVIVLMVDGSQKLLFKHSISSITPNSPISYGDYEDEK
ncbi:MAG: RNA chaperone Hfq [Clostridiales bacterium]|jgi:host factor-I protein|nr:RNA chaperone Hfq [Clostridiales bacterium]